MAKEITMPERQDEPSQAEVDKMTAEECALAIQGKLDTYKRTHGLQTNAGLGMMLLARARTLLTEYVAMPPPAQTTPEGFAAFIVPEKHAAMVQQTIDYLNQTDPV